MTDTIPRRRRRRLERETPDYADMLSRMVRSYAVRVGNGDPVDLARMLDLRSEVDAAIVRAARAQHDEGFSWGEIAAACRMTRQAAHQRFGRIADDVNCPRCGKFMCDDRAACEGLR